MRVSQVVKSQVFQPCIFQDFLVDVDHRVRVVHLACFRGWEHPWAAGMLLVFCDQQINGILRNGDFADGVFCFRARDVRFACIVSPCLLADGNRLVFDVQVRPLERHQFAFAQSADELQIEHRQDTTLVGGCQIGLDLLWRQDLHFVLRDFGWNAVICRFSDNQPFFDCAVEGIVQHRVDAADRVRSAFFSGISPMRGVICFLLILEKRYHNSAGARMGSDHTSYGRIANFFQFSLPDVTAVFDIF